MPVGRRVLLLQCAAEGVDHWTALAGDKKHIGMERAIIKKKNNVELSMDLIAHRCRTLRAPPRSSAGIQIRIVLYTHSLLALPRSRKREKKLGRRRTPRKKKHASFT